MTDTITGVQNSTPVTEQSFYTLTGTGSIANHFVGLDKVYTLANSGNNNLVRAWQPIFNLGGGGTTTLLQFVSPELQFGSGQTVTEAHSYDVTWNIPAGATVGIATDFHCNIPNNTGGTLTTHFCANFTDPSGVFATKGLIRNDAGELGAMGIGGDTTRIYMGNHEILDMSTLTASGTVAHYLRSIVVTAGKVYLIPFANHNGKAFTYSNAYLRIDGAVAASSCFGQIYTTASGRPIGAPLFGTQVTWASTATGQITGAISPAWSGNNGIYLLAVYCNAAVTLRFYPEAWQDLVGLAGVTNIPQAPFLTPTSSFPSNPAISYAGSGADLNILTPYVGLGF